MKRVLLVGYDPETVDFADPALPPGMTYNGNRMSARILVICFSESASETGIHTQHRKVRAGYQQHIHLLHLAACPIRVYRAMYAPGHAHNCSSIRKDFVALSYLLIKRVGEEVCAAFWEIIGQTYSFPFAQKH